MLYCINAFYNVEGELTATDAVEKSISENMDWIRNQGYHAYIAGYERRQEVLPGDGRLIPK